MAARSDEGERRRADELEHEQARPRSRRRRRRRSAAGGGRSRRSAASTIAAEPDHQRRQRDVPDDEHLLIIIAGLQDPRLAELEEVAARAAAAVAGEEPVDAAVRDVPAAPLSRNRRGRSCATRSGWRSRGAGARRQRRRRVVGRAGVADAVRRSGRGRRRRADPARRRRSSIAALRATWPAGTRDRRRCRRRSRRACAPRRLSIRGELVPDAIDELERVVGGSYRPGEGLVARPRRHPRARQRRRSRARRVGAADRVRAHRPAAVCDAGRRADAADRRARDPSPDGRTS